MAWPRDAFVGQKVVCKVPPYKGEPAPYTLVGGVYTIARIYANEWDGAIMFDFAEFGIPERKEQNGWTTGFAAVDYRPVDPASKKADRVLASLKPSLLNPIPIRKYETAGGE